VKRWKQIGRTVAILLAFAVAGGALAAESGSPSSRAVDIVAEGDEIRVLTETPVNRAKSFQLEGPARLVLDLPDATGALRHDPPSPSSGPVEQIRVGQHPDKLRVVLDLRNPIVSYRVETTAEGVRISLAPATPPRPDEHLTEAAPMRDASALPPVGAGPRAPTDRPSSVRPHQLQKRLIACIL
jgi:type IV pilus assembly protein PilQ